MRLIDADELKESLCDWCITKSHCPCGLILDIDNTPTAFDVDKVQKKIWDINVDTYRKLLEAVKRGGVDE